ncbi:MAG TPA: cytochrome C oxidase subunit IV family protein [Prolixibacteraceae bacterium]|jgi:cytochrome c oxidase subunit 4|nr:cytochrome C oxidase subunit IV family protein [Prolixibacteraceae bacterium]
MKNHDNHITSDTTNWKVLLILLILTTLSILVLHIHVGAFTVALALLLASVKVTIVLTYFMHLKFEYALLRVMVGGVFLLFAIVIAITFIDYYFR